MGHLFFYLFAVAACLLWSAAFVAAAARTERAWFRRLLAAIAVLVPPLSLIPFVGLTGVLAFVARIETNWFAPTLTACIAALAGGLSILWAGLSRDASTGGFVAAAWPVVGLAAMFVMAKAVAFGTLLCIDNAVAAEARAIRAEATHLMLANLPPQPLPDDDAAPLYVRAARAFEADKPTFYEQSPASDPLTADPGSPDVAAILERHAATLDLVRRAADSPGCRFDRDWSRPSGSMLLPQIHTLRSAARLLALAARRSAAAGDAAGGLRDIVRIQRIGAHAAAEPLLLSGLVGVAIDAQALEMLASVLPAMRNEDLPLLDGEEFCDRLATPVSLARGMRGEEALGLATFADLADGRPRLSELFELTEPAAARWTDAAPVALLFRSFLLPADIAGYRKSIGTLQALADRLTGPDREPYPAIEKQIDACESNRPMQRAGVVTALLVPAPVTLLPAQARGLALHEAAAVLVAATRARLASGSVPESIDALVPRWLPAVPRDPFTTDAPLRWKQEGDTLLVNSVGKDGEDDGGPPAPDAERSQGNDDVGLRMTVGR